MRFKISGLTLKMTLGIVLFGLVLGGVSGYIGYREFTTVLEHQYNDTAYEVAETAKTYLNADRLEEYLETGETDAEFEAIQTRLDELTDSANVTFIYVAKVDPSDYMTLTYIYDSVNSSTGFSRYPLGYTAKDIDPQYVGNVEKVMTTGERVTEHCYSYSKESGAHTTAALAVENSGGEIIALLCVEKAMTTLENARAGYVRQVAVFTAVFVLAALLLYMFYLHREVLKPILKVAQEAKRFAENNVEVSDVLADVKRRDEIGTLALAIHKMEHDIDAYIRNLSEITAEKERISAELAVATEIQASMLPTVFPQRSEFDIYATMNPAKEVGGDFYDFFLVDESHVAIVMADVSGKGVPAALFMVIGKTLIKDHTKPGRNLGEVFTEANNLLCEANSEGLFITAFEGVLDLRTGEFCYVNAGHEMPFIARNQEEFVPYRIKPGFVLAGMEEMRYQSGVLQLSPGDMIFQYTDGVTEATNAENELYGMERLQNVLNRCRTKEPKEILEAVKCDVEAFVKEAPQFDDITMLCLSYREKMEEIA